MTHPQKLFHLTPAEHWYSLADDDIYYPATYEQDGFIHATSDASVLINIANHFYRATEGDWICLETTVDRVEATGVKVVFEPPAPVGDTDANIPGVTSTTLFPHLFGGLTRDVVDKIHSVERDNDGRFLAIPAL